MNSPRWGTEPPAAELGADLAAVLLHDGPDDGKAAELDEAARTAAELAELARLVKDLPQFCVWRETREHNGTRSARYAAQAVAEGVNPRFVLSADPDEIRAVVADAAARDQAAGG